MTRTVQQRSPQTPADASQASAAAGTFRYDKETFWTANEVLGKTLAAAQARGTGRWALLINNIVRTSMLIPPSVVLPPIVQSHASLNYFAAVAAESGGGKSGSESVAYEMVWIDDTPVLRPSTGQGVTATYVKYVAATKGNQREGIEPEPAHQERTEWRALLSVDEIGSLEARAGAGNSLMPDTRTGWMGKALGSATVTRENRLSVAAHSYRLGLVVGTQLGAAGFLLTDSDVGTPQRFVFVPAQDDSDLSDDEIEGLTLEALRARRAGEVERITLDHLPSQDYERNWDTWEPSGFHMVSVCDAAQFEVLLDSERRVKKYPPHHLLCQLKTACLLSFYCGGSGDVTDDYWALAGVVMQVSEETKQMLREHAERAEAEENERQAMKRGEAEVVKIDRMAEIRDQKVEKQCQRILETLKAGPLTEREFAHMYNSRTRTFGLTAMTLLADAGRVIHAGEMYALNDEYAEEGTTDE